MEEKCWICGRTINQLRKDDVSGEVETRLADKEDVLIKLESVQWVHMNPVCCVCLDIFTTYMINQNVSFDDEIEEKVMSGIKKAVSEGIKISISK